MCRLRSFHCYPVITLLLLLLLLLLLPAGY